MIKPMLAAAALALTAPVACATPATEPVLELEAPTSQSLVGTWSVSLYFAPDTPPSSTVLEITEARKDGTLVGSFCNTPFEQARYTERGSEIIFTAITSDGSGPYATSGRLGTSGSIEGQTLSTGRGFLMAWSAAPAGEN